MTKYYSAIEEGFYDSNIHSTIPEDGVAISDQLHEELLEDQADGKVIVDDGNGNPIAVVPSYSNALLIQAAADRIRLILTNTAWTQAADEYPGTQALWAPYRQLIRDVPLQAGYPSVIVWPPEPV